MGNAPHSEGEGYSDVKEELYTRSGIELYTNTLSAAPGDHLTLHVSTRARQYALRIARVGLKEEDVWTQDGLPGVFYPTPPEVWKKGCAWPVAVHLDIPVTWRSGYYQIKAVTADADRPTTESLAFVVIRASKPTAKILLVLATNTYGAYNNYGGANFYVKHDGRSGGYGEVGVGEHRVSFRRPWMPGFLSKPDHYRWEEEWGLSELSDPTHWDERTLHRQSGLAFWSNAAGFHNWERVIVRWLEHNGYAVDYAVSSDLEFHPTLLGQYRLMLSVGHDEYWSWGMRDTVESFISCGGNVCFFSGNLAFLQVRYEDHGQTLVCYKDEYEEDPHFREGRRTTATYWSSAIVGRPETQMTGLTTFDGGYARFAGTSPQGAGGYLIYRPQHWVFEGTGLTFGDCMGSAVPIVRFEVDGCPIRMEEGLPYPAHDYEGPKSLEILGLHPAAWPASGRLSEWAQAVFGDARPKARDRFSGNHHHAIMSLYTNNGTVFSAGTTDWTYGLASGDPAVERVTRNLLDRLSI